MTEARRIAKRLANRKWRKNNRVKQAEKTLAWRRRNKEQYRQLTKKAMGNWRRKNPGYWKKHSKEYLAACQSRWRAKNREKVAAGAARYHNKLREEVIKEYGGKCTCCRETNPLFLTVDHINNDGAAERKLIGGRTIYAHLKKIGFPKDRYQLLCFNCNCGRNRNKGICPHKTV